MLAGAGATFMSKKSMIKKTRKGMRMTRINTYNRAKKGPAKKGAGNTGRKLAHAAHKPRVAINKVHAKHSTSKSIPRVSSVEAKQIRKKEEADLYKMDAKKVIEEIVANGAAMEYLHKNVSKRAGEVITSLVIPKTDEKIAEELDIKINTVRRILNIMYGYGITNYNVIKNSKGWLSFLWSMNLKKVNEFYNYIGKTDNNSAIINENSNDYFVCNDCYNNNKLVFDFDSAFEASFKCVLCGNKLQRLDKEGAKRLIDSKDDEEIARATV